MKFPLIISFVFLVSCDKAWEDPGPRTVFESFMIHTARGRTAEAFEMIDPEDREKLSTGIDKLPEALRPKTEDQLVVAGVDSKFDIKRIEILKSYDTEPPAGESLELKLHYVDESTKSAHLVWRDKWYVDLIREP